MAPIEIRSYFSRQPLLQHTSSAKVITRKLIDAQIPGTLLPAINSTPGVRMEERSPGSYRLALRGSMLRSPFGVRNTKIYIDEIPLTDAGGNTYLNSLDPVGIQQITILKGPDGSLFGPNSGGVVRIAPYGFDLPEASSSLLLSGGSFGTANQQLHHSQSAGDRYQFSLDQAWMRSDGYRDNTALHKIYLQTAHQWHYTPKAQWKLFALYSDLSYATPGGLTQTELEENPRQARPATATLPGAVAQQAAIYNKTTLGGLTHEYRWNERLMHSATIFGSYTDLRNPFITNYERRYERNTGVRTYFSYQDDRQPQLIWQMQLGLEAQQGRYDITNFQNLGGSPGKRTKADLLHNRQHFYFYRAAVTFREKWSAEASAGLHFNTLKFRQFFPETTSDRGQIHFPETWMPRLAISYRIHRQIALRSSISKGYSPPTMAEIRSSDNQVNPRLRSESGINYEAGLRAETYDRRWIADASMYHYALRDGIVRQLLAKDQEYFVNAGQISQRGVEILLMGQLLPAVRQSRFIRSLYLSSATTFQHYTFRSYNVWQDGQLADYRGNRVTSIPRWISVHTMQLSLPKQIGLDIVHNYTSEIPLNDANTVFARGYHLLQARVHGRIAMLSHLYLQAFAGVDNLLNQRYSLGNDINVSNGRYFNAAPARNYYVGLKIGR